MKNKNSNLVIVADEYSQYINLAIEFAERIVKIKMKVAIFNLTDDAQEELQDRIPKNKRNKLYIDKNGDLTIDYIEQKSKELKDNKKIDVIIIDLEEKDININYKELSKRLRDLSLELGLTIEIFTQIKGATGTTITGIEDVENEEITDYADMVYVSKFNDKNEKVAFVAKSNNDKYPVGYLRK